MIYNSPHSRESLDSDESYEESEEDELEIPKINPLSEAIFNKYQHNQQAMLDPVIREEDEDEITETEN